MKKLIIPFLIAVTLVFQACEPTESVIYDGSQTLAYFPGASSVQLSVPAADAQATINVPLNVSTLSSSDRVISLSVLGTSTASTDQYSFTTSVTVPANSYFTSFDITGFQNNLSDTSPVTVVINIDGVDDGGVGSPTRKTVSIIKTCPFDITDFYGTYTTQQAFNSTSLAAGSSFTAAAGPADNTLLLTDIFGAGRQAVIELDPDSGVVSHRSQEFGAVYQTFASTGPLHTWFDEPVILGFGLGINGENSFNTCNFSINLNYYRTNSDGSSVYGGEYIIEATKN